MHQTHNIAWDSLSSHLVFIAENPAVTPRRSDLFPRRLPSQANSLNHFARTVSTTIKEFSDTERAKYPACAEAPLKGLLFSDSLLSRYSGLPYSSVTASAQLIESWIDMAKLRSQHMTDDPTPSYNTGQGNLADVVKVLMAENEMGQLLMLAQHPLVPLKNLHCLSWGHSFGWDHVGDWALDAYIFFNVLLSKPELHANGRYKSMQSYRLVNWLTCSTDYDAQCFPHREFFWGSSETHASVPVDKLEPLVDVNKLHEYLKTCFRLLYRYDMLARECGQRVDWEDMVALAVARLWKVKTDYREDERGGYICRFA
ncbi:hypothetical protein C8R43DRAFT_1030628 [Mycena crocata]|nr:hypothetical protein C8R43DRAFT_1030628 [Mycena crocata]